MTTVLPHSDQPQTDFNRLLKIGFWGNLVVVGGLFAAVYLAPSYVAYQKLKVQRYDNQVKLVTLEHYVQYLESASHAVRQSPNTVSVASSLSPVVDNDFVLDTELLQPMEKIPEAKTSRYMPQLELLASNGSTRQSLMAAAAFLLMFGFVFLQDSSAVRLQTAAKKMGNCFRWVTNRYSSPEELEDDEEENESLEDDFS